MLTAERRQTLVRKILLAYLARTEVPWADLPALEPLIGDALARLPDRSVVPRAADQPVKPTPTEIAASIRPDGLVSFIDGRAYKMLKPHLRSHGLTPLSYRRRYGLPDDYPTTCADYGARRAGIAKGIGLGGSLPYPRETDRRPSDRPRQREITGFVPSLALSSRSRSSRPRKSPGPGSEASA